MESADELSQVGRFWHTLAAHGARVAIWEDGRLYGYDHLLEKAQSAVRELKEAGVQPGDVVALLAKFGTESVARWVALLKFGAVAAVFPSEYGATAPRIATAHSRWIWVPGGPLAATGDARPQPKLLGAFRDKPRSGIVLVSGGTSGVPKAALHDGNSFLQARESAAHTGYRLLCTMPMGHMGGLDALTRLLWCGGTLVASSKGDPSGCADAACQAEADVLVATPSYLNLMLLSDSADALGKALRIVAYGAEPMPPALMKRLQARWPAVGFRQRFGTTETGAIPVLTADASTGAIRIDPAEAEYRVIDHELWLRAPGKMLGYLDDDCSSLSPDGWFATGDLVEERGGNLLILGRRSGLVNVGGHKVHPEEVERVLWDVPGVASMRAFGEPNAITGQALALNVTAVSGVDLPDLRLRLRAAATASLPPYKRPVNIRFSERAELTLAGKQQRSPL